MGALILSFLAGILTALSPCVLPALPLLVAGARSESRAGPIAMAAGLVSAFAIVGYALASMGTVAGLEIGTIRSASALLLAASGVLLLSERLQSALAGAVSAGLGRWSDGIQRGRYAGALGQFGLGALLGVLWSPCAGPTLGAAIGLASRESGSLRALAQMTAFGAGAAASLLAAGLGMRRLGSRRAALVAWTGRLRPALGAFVIALALVYLAGWETAVQAALLAWMPAGLSSSI